METTLEVREQSQVAEVRRLVAELGRAQGFSEVDLGRAALVATEASTNLVKYADRGTMTIERYTDAGSSGVQFISLDRGPGFHDFAAASRDGHSTGRSLGLGLGVIMRSSDAFDVYTLPGQGSAFFSRVARERRAPRPAPQALDIGARCAPMRGESECGDAWATARSGNWQRICVVDGLGHGPLAASAAAAALAVFHAAREADAPSDIVARCHVALKATRGAVMAVVAIDPGAGLLVFAGVGNIAAVVYGDSGASHLLSTEGIVGYQVRKIRDAHRRWSAADTLVLSSDGLSTRWNMARYPGLLQRRPELVASVLFRDFARDNDDATIVVARQPA
jgi:anti-sigma regulatory factor (Ser/Thr protein kinase)